MFTLFWGKGEIAMDKAFEGMNKREELYDKSYDLSLLSDENVIHPIKMSIRRHAFFFFGNRVK
jgi:hypothetical protein